MSDKSHAGIIGLNSTIRELHDEMKSLALTCSAEFPQDAVGGVEFLADVVELQTVVSAYGRELLVFLLQLVPGSAKKASPVLSHAPAFVSLWEERKKLANHEKRSENQIYAAIRQLVNILLRQMRSLGEEEMRVSNRNEDIAQMLYYLNTLEEALCWYTGRYLARITGEFTEMEK
jgi:hypothetical protein